MAPPRRPNHLKILSGTREDRINRNEPLPAESAIVPPVQLSEGCRREPLQRRDHCFLLGQAGFRQ